MVLKEQSTPFGQTSNQTTIFPTHNLDFIDSVSGMEFCTQLWPSRIWCIIISVPKTWRHLYVYGYFLHHRWEHHKTIKTRKVLSTGLRNSYALPSSFEVNNLSQINKRCKTGTQTFFKYPGKKSPPKTFICPLFIFSPLCLLSSTKLLPYLLHSWLNNKWSTFDYFEIFQDPL